MLIVISLILCHFMKTYGYNRMAAIIREGKYVNALPSHTAAKAKTATLHLFGMRPACLTVHERQGSNTLEERRKSKGLWVWVLGAVRESRLEKMR